MAEVIGQDGWARLCDAFDPLAPPWLRDIPAVQVLRRIWVQNYSYENEHIQWREQGDIPPATLSINSPYDLDAREAQKAQYDVDRL